MTFQNDWEDFFRKSDSGAPLAPEEEKCARAIRALRASGKVPPADPAFLDGLWGSLRAEYVTKCADRRPARASFFSTWFGPWSAALACLAAVAVLFSVLPWQLPARPAAPSPAPAVSDSGTFWKDVAGRVDDRLKDVFDPSRTEAPYCKEGENCSLSNGSDIVANGVNGLRSGIVDSSFSLDDASIAADACGDLECPPGRGYFRRILIGFLSLTVAAYSALGTLLILVAAWRDRCRRSRARLAADGAAALACFLAFCLAAAVAVLVLASLGVDLSWRPFLARAVGFPELFAFAAACAVSAMATVGAVSRAVRAGASGFPRLAVTLAAAPWLPTVALYLASPRPSAALANASFLALGTLALAASVWPRVPPAEPLDRLMAMAAVLLVSFPTYAYFFQPRTASAAEVFVCCAVVLAWAAAWSLSAARRPRWA